MHSLLILVLSTALCLGCVDSVFQALNDLGRVLRSENGCACNYDIASCVAQTLITIILQKIIEKDRPASAQTPIVLGPTPPSTSMSFSGKRARSSATFGTQLSINFWPPRPSKDGLKSRRKEEMDLRRTGVYSHNKQHVCSIGNFVCDSS